MPVTFKPRSQQIPAYSSNLTKAPAVKFSGINANLTTNTTRDQYVKAYQEHPEEHLLNQSATSIFREFDSCQAVGQLLKDKKPTAIHVLGCSDGSEVYSYAISAQQQLPKKDIKDANKIQLTGVDMTRDLIAFANTGHLVCSDVEKARQVQAGNPLADGKWPNFFELKKDPPAAFAALVREFPRLEQIVRDPVAKIKVGDGMQWYKVKQKGLPKIDFQADTIEHYVTKPTSSHQRQIFILANSWGYMMVKNADNPANMEVELKDKEKIMKFLDVIKNIKKNSQGKEVIIVVGEIERQIMEKIPTIKNLLPVLGLEPMTATEMHQAGIQSKPLLQGRIWRLST